MMRHKVLVLSSLWVGVTLAACTAMPRSREEGSELHGEVELAIAKFRKADPKMEKFFDSAQGYAVLPSIGKIGLGIGGAHGTGEVFEKGTLIGYCSMSQATIGLQAGGQAYSEIIFFRDEAALAKFKQGDTSFSAQASAVAAKEGASTAADYAEGVLVFTMVQSGLMYEASVGGQKFKFQPLE